MTVYTRYFSFIVPMSKSSTTRRLDKLALVEFGALGPVHVARTDPHLVEAFMRA